MIIRKKLVNGFTLLEVLIALLVLSVGLLGLASLQTRGLAAGHNAYLRSQAVLLARDMAERIRANTTHIANNQTGSGSNYNFDWDRSINSSAKNCVFDENVSGTPCTASELATFDGEQWLTALSNTLPSGEGRVNQSDRDYTIIVRWDQDGDTNPDNHKTYTYQLNL